MTGVQTCALPICGWQKTAIAAVFLAGMATAVTPVGAAIFPVVQGLLSSVPDAASAAVTELAR